MKNKSQNRLAILNRHMNAWAELPRTNRQLVAELVVEQFQAMGLGEYLAGTGVDFKTTADAASDMRTRAQKINRWLGNYEDQPASPDRLFYLEQAMVAAMPEQIRLDYLGEVYQHAGVSVCALGESDKASMENMVQALIKENSEAQMALLGLSENSSPEDVEKVLREMAESEAATQRARRLIAGRFGLTV